MTRPMDALSPPPPASRTAQAAAFAVHVFTAAGAGIALLAMMAAVRGDWSTMFGWLGLALVVDGIDGPLARRLNVRRVLPDWSGDALDFVVDFITYVFVPAYAIMQSGLLVPWSATVLGMAIVISSALYFADKRMKTSDNHFRGFPALWNAAAFYLFLLKPSPILASLTVLALVVLTFVPFHVIHPVRVTRWRRLNLALIAIWAVLAIIAIAQDFVVAWPVSAALCGIALYIVGADAMLRLLRPRS
ncbi:MAG: phosphatidylcholine synthase [Tardiphaga sp.]|uniref:CDP-alcohol phosphatidyltransferase family protein n=1 Tax=Tardiphaga sp. TaxID=1926292 RepID=UPI0019AC0138|nr:CDP-alcohol phosphatidyltransferase family protein [Tardiphaga sp.]MBC7582702.1 phosphatidylcholine synthase [Tardiphaga sp.]